MDPTSLTYTNNATISTDCSTLGSWIGERGTLTVDSGQFKYTIDSQTGSPKGIYRGNSIAANKVYRIRFKAKSPTLTANFQYIGNYQIIPIYIKNPNLITDYQDYEFYAASNANAALYLATGLTANLNGQIIYYDDIIIDEVNLPAFTTQIGTKVNTSYPLLNWTKFVSNFEASATEVNQDIKLYLNTSASVYVDNVSLTQAYDVVLNTVHKQVNTTDVKTILELGECIRIVQVNDSAYVGFSSAIFQYANTGFLNTYQNVLGILDRTNTRWYTYQNNVLAGGVFAGNPSALGKNSTTSFVFIKNGSTYWTGSVSKLQILRFTNISQSSFDPTTYKIGQSLLGGGAEVVLWFDPSKDGSSIENTIKDWSGNNNNLLTSSIDLTNRVLTH